MIRNQSFTVLFYAYNSSDGSAATGISGWTVYVSKDAATPVVSTNSAMELASSTAPGIYKITLTASEMDAKLIALTFSSSSAKALPILLETAAAPLTVSEIQNGLSTLTTANIPTSEQIADTILGRSVSLIETTAAEHSLCTIILAALESRMSESALTIYRTDGATVHLTKQITTSANALPITGIQ